MSPIALETNRNTEVFDREIVIEPEQCRKIGAKPVRDYVVVEPTLEEAVNFRFLNWTDKQSDEINSPATLRKVA